MSDTPVIQPPAFVCEECGKSYPSMSGLQGHKISHRPPINCPECGKMYRSPGALGNHRKHHHGVLSMNGHVTTRMPKLKEWNGDEIFTSVLTLLWPSGVVPIHAIVPLIQWREDTQHFLEKVQ